MKKIRQLTKEKVGGKRKIYCGFDHPFSVCDRSRQSQAVGAQLGVGKVVTAGQDVKRTSFLSSTKVQLKPHILNGNQAR